MLLLRNSIIVIVHNNNFQYSNRDRNMKNLGLGIIAGLGLSACVTINGASMGTTDNKQQVTEYPVEATMLNIYTKARSAKLMAMVNGQTVSADIKVTPKGAMLFNGKSVQGGEISTISTLSGQVTNQAVATNYFTLNPLVFHGFTDNTGIYSLSNQTSTIPKSARVGESSSFVTDNVYTDQTMSQKLGTYEQTWSLTQDSNKTAWFCIETSGNLLLNNDPNSASTECYNINAQGDILASKVIITQPTENGNGTIELMSQ